MGSNDEYEIDLIIEKENGKVEEDSLLKRDVRWKVKEDWWSV